MKRKVLAIATGILLSLTTAVSGTAVMAASGTGTVPPDLPGGAKPSGPAPSGSFKGTAPGSNGSGPASDGQKPEGQSGQMPAGPGGGADTQTYDYTGDVAGTLDADGSSVSSDRESIDSSSADVNTVLAENGGTAAVTNAALTKSGDDTNGDNCNFYGLNSVVLAVGDNSAAYVSDSRLNAVSEGSNALFATDNGTIYANNDSIHTTAGNSRGLDATYGGTVIANRMEITTEDDHCAAAATDRGGGNISVTNSTFHTTGSGSPLLYSTGDIEADNITGVAEGSQIAGMEGLNTILINHSHLTSTITSATASDPVANGVIIYQSTSGDAESTTGDRATFQATGSTLTSSIRNGAMFYITNTDANVLLSDTTLNFDSASNKLFQIEGNSSNNWGTEGSNGADVTASLDKEDVSGDISVDNISSLDLYLLNGTKYQGAISIVDNSNAADTVEDPVTVNLDASSVWVVTADSTISNLNAEDGATIVDSEGNPVTIVVDGNTVVSGTSSYTVTVTDSYSNTVTLGENNALDVDFIDRTAFDDYYGTTTTFGNNQDTE